MEGGSEGGSGGKEEETKEMRARQAEAPLQRLWHGLLPAQQEQAPLQGPRHGLLPARQAGVPLLGTRKTQKLTYKK
jgi:hypothetical protein